MSTEPAKVLAGEAVPDDPLALDSVLARFNGDALAALAVAIKDIRYLEHELGYASIAMSIGFARGWRPGIASQDDRQ